MWKQKWRRSSTALQNVTHGIALNIGSIVCSLCVNWEGDLFEGDRSWFPEFVKQKELQAQSHFFCVGPRILKNTVFTRIQSICNLWHPKNKTSKEKYFTINFIHLIHTACHILSTFTNHCHCFCLTVKCFHFLDSPSKYSHPLHWNSTTYQSHLLHWIYST